MRKLKLSQVYGFAYMKWKSKGNILYEAYSEMSQQCSFCKDSAEDNISRHYNCGYCRIDKTLCSDDNDALFDKISVKYWELDELVDMMCAKLKNRYTDNKLLEESDDK